MVNRIKDLLIKHYLVIMLALIVGVLTALPQIFAARGINNFQGIYKSVSSDESYYMARAKDVMDGHSYLANPYLYEYKKGYPMQLWLPDYILAKPLAVIGADLHQGYIFYDFLLPFILTLLTYSIFFLLSRSIPLSFLGSMFLHIGLFLWEFGRAPSPQLNFIFWLLLFLFWLRFLEKSTLSRALAVGVVFGILFHIYPYYWTFYALVFIIFILINLILKKQIDYKKYFIALFAAFIISIAYFLPLIKSMRLPFYSETIARVGMIHSHFPAGRKLVMSGILTLLLFYYLLKKKKINLNAKTILFLSGTLSSIIVVNQHVITGKHLQFSDHYWPLSAFWFTFAVILLLSAWLDSLDQKKKKIVLTLGGVFVFFISLNPIINACQITYTENEIRQQNYAPVFRWLNENALPEEVIFADSELSDFIPVYTSNNVFYNGMAGLHFMSNKEFQERFILNNFWDDFSYEYVLDNHYAIAGAYYRSKFGHDLTKNKLRKIIFLEPKEYSLIPDEAIDEFIKYAQEIKSKDFENQLKKYKVDYFIWNRYAQPHWRINELNFLKKVKDFDNLSIYKVE